jgi:checkpoint serine/threonine-protein kinase
VNPKNGRTEHVHVNLEALYPRSQASGTELTFEELIAAHRGWLDKVWKPETTHPRIESPNLADKTDESNFSADMLSEEVSERLLIAHDPVMVDENGAAKEHGREGKARKMKIKEVNETQISQSYVINPCDEAYRK